MNQILERLSMLTGMRDEMKEQITEMGEVDCQSPEFKDIDDAVKRLDTHHIHRLRVSLDLGEEIPLSQWLSAIREGRPILTPEQAVRLLSRATDRMEKAFEGLVDKAIAMQVEVHDNEEVV